MHSSHLHHRADLVRIAISAMTERGLEPEFPERARQQLAATNRLTSSTE